jgi:hypothetical protein
LERLNRKFGDQAHDAQCGQDYRQPSRAAREFGEPTSRDEDRNESPGDSPRGVEPYGRW